MVENASPDEQFLNQISRLNNELVNAQRELARLNAELIRQKEQVDAANDQLRLINKMMRHDFLNYLMIIDASVNSYLDSKDDTLMPSASKAIRRSIGLIGHIKKLENATNQHPELRFFDVGKIVSEATASHGIKFTIEGEGTVLADLDFHSVIENLVSNAIIHGGAKAISCRIVNEGGFVVIDVADDGKGIPDDVKGRIFAEGYTYGETGRSGLGLYIVKSVIEKYGGTIGVTDNQPNGSIFTMRLLNARSPNNP